MYLIFLIIFIFKGISPLKAEDSKTSIGNIEGDISIYNRKNDSIINKKDNSNDISNKKIMNINIGNNNITKTHKRRIKNVKFPPKRKNNNNKAQKFSQMVNKSDIISTKRQINELPNPIQNNDMQLTQKNNEKEMKKEELSDFELNKLEYLEAIRLDKRKFPQIYCSILKRQHLIIFTFASWDDYNLWYIKLSRFFFLIATNMAFNVLFFSDETIHKIYLNYGKYDFIQQIPQIIYSTIISQLIELLLCYLCFTDKHVYQIRKIKDKNLDKNNIIQILKCMRIKLIGFYVFTFIFFLAYWYIITAFCAVYQNTQISFIKNSTFSFIIGIVYPIVLYLFPPILRLLALKDDKNKRFKCIYVLGGIIPIF